MASQDPKDHQATQALQESPESQESPVSTANQDVKETQVLQESQVHQARMGSTATQARITTHQHPSQPQNRLTPTGAAGASTESASTGQLTAAAAAPTKDQTNHRPLLKT